MSRWISIDDYFAAAGESWATVGSIRPGDRYRAPRAALVDDDHEQAADPGTAATSTSARTTPTTRRPRP